MAPRPQINLFHESQIILTHFYLRYLYGTFNEVVGLFGGEFNDFYTTFRSVLKDLYETFEFI